MIISVKVEKRGVMVLFLAAKRMLDMQVKGTIGK